MSFNMEKKFLIRPAAPNAGYGYRIWISEDERDMIKKLNLIAMWGGSDKRYLDSEGNAIISFEITPYDNDKALGLAQDALKDAGFSQIIGLENTMQVFETYSQHF